MNIDYLIKMANQIGAFFESQPDSAQASADLAKHIKNSWEPRMRQALLAHVADHQGDGLNDFVRQAIARHGQSLV
ncbi:MAG: formate dehydrogenase [Rhodocyclaceae bacterium]|nr:MAG: formate dehydrogenase [Rhodocyclaceae bacterium]